MLFSDMSILGKLCTETGQMINEEYTPLFYLKDTEASSTFFI